MSTLQVNTINAATAGQAVAVDIQNPKSFRNLVINGAMNVAQRGTSSTTESSYTVDRFKAVWSGLDESLTYSQHALTSSDTGPWAKGFRNSLHVQNGNQTSGAGAADRAAINYTFEARDIANSGWDYTSASSYVTLSFWVKSSVAQTFYFSIRTDDGTGYNYPIETGSLTADTWTKVTKTIPGNSNLTVNNDNGVGLIIEMVLFRGTDSTGTITLNQWSVYSGSVRTPNNTSTWYTTNDSTFEITGIQLEVGDVATDFEHRSYGEELVRCHRYYQLIANGLTNYFAMAYLYIGTVLYAPIRYATPMRTGPTLDYNTGAYYTFYRNNAGDAFETLTWSWANEHSGALHHSTAAGQISGTAGQAGGLFCNHASGKIALTAEL